MGKFRVSTAPHIRTNDTTRSIMRDVLIALCPALAAGVYFFGIRALVVTAICVASSVASEYLFQLAAKRKSTIGDFSAAVTGMLLGLSLPVTAPWWMCIIGSVVAIVLVKQLFGGIGDNFLNPALAARAVLLASWPTRMSAAAYVNPNYFGSIDAVTTATPLAGGEASLLQLLLGDIPGSIGEICKVAIVLGFIYLLFRHVISWHVPTIIMLSASLLTWAFVGGGIETPIRTLLSGGLMFAAVFMATDYTTSPMTAVGQIIYALGIGLLIAVIRCFAGYPEGVTYAILFMNIVTPLIDKYIKPRIYGDVAEVKRNA